MSFDHIVAILQTIGIIGGSGLLAIAIRHVRPIVADKKRLAKERDAEKYRADVATAALELLKSTNEGLSAGLEQVNEEMHRLRTDIFAMGHKLALAVRWMCDSMRARAEGKPDPLIPTELQDDIDEGMRQASPSLLEHGEV